MQLRDEKNELEKKKLALEISHLNRPWYKKNNSLMPVLTFIITVATILWTCSTGILDVKYQALIKDKKILELDIKEFQTKKDSIAKENMSSKLLADSLTQQVEILQSRKEKLDQDISKILGQYKTESKKVQALITEIDYLNQVYQTKLSDTIRKLDVQNQEEKYRLNKTADGFYDDLIQLRIDFANCQLDKEILERKIKELKKQEQK